MSKPVKNMIVDAYRRRFDEVGSAVMIDIRGVNANDNQKLRNHLAEREIRVTLVKNSLAQRAWRDTALDGLCGLLDGSCAVAYGGSSVVEVARLLIDQAREINLTFKGALMEGEVFGPDEVEKLSKYPTREEAQAQVIQVFLGPAGQVIGAALSGGSQIASILQAIEEKLEKGETIAKAG
ncbi:MAG: 50S ribosomal protein L10 [Phycisphaeraceae bacterium]|nr:50S ribosomal protein L10 [Phycisphaeraceae bacterium]